MQKKSGPAELERFYSLEAEAGVLGAMIIEPTVIGNVLPMLPRADAFYLREHRTIYETLVKLFIDGRPIDAVTLRDELKQAGQLAQLKGDETKSVAYLGRIMETVPSASNAVYYARIVREKDKERQVWSAVQQIKNVPDVSGSVDEKIQTLQDIALGLEPMKAGPEFIEAGRLAPNVLAAMREGDRTGIATGFQYLDRMLQGFQPGEFVILAGRPSMGKSALMLDIALNISKAGTGVLIFSLEMSEQSLVDRAICNLAAIDRSRIAEQFLDSSDWNSLEYAVDDLRKRPIILSRAGSTPEQAAGLIHRLKQTHDVGIVFIDYVQLMTSDKKTESRQQEMTTISRKLKNIAGREDIPLIVLSQLNRAVDARTDHRPRMSDLRESGSLEQDADAILFVYSDDYYHKDEPGFVPSGIAEIIVSKNRRGPTGKVRLVFVRDYVKFTEVATEYDEALQKYRKLGQRPNGSG